MAINIFCPFCGAKTQTRTSERPTKTTIKAQIYCPSCGNLKAEFIGELTNIKRAEFVDVSNTDLEENKCKKQTD